MIKTTLLSEVSYKGILKNKIRKVEYLTQLVSLIIEPSESPDMRKFERRLRKGKFKIDQ